ncbi:MAG: adenosylhomocysteinase [Clostridia bacterium]|nr:adenosylhomocysteinase [Clostridia bacterium]
MSEIRSASLAPFGEKKIEWVSRNMPLLNSIKRDFEHDKPFDTMRVTVCIHVEAKTAYMARILAAGGAKVAVTGCNPLSTQDDVAAALADGGIETFAMHGVNSCDYTRLLDRALDIRPNLFIDDGGDLLDVISVGRRDLISDIIAGTEETTTGILRLRAREAEGGLSVPMIAVNDADCKHLFDNRYGTGQSVWNGINSATNLIVAGKTAVIAGYGWCGKGCAMRAKGLGARVIVCEVNAVRALEAYMDGFEVMSMDLACAIGDIFITVTGCEDVIVKRHFEKMKDGVILANAGHFDVEISKPDLEAASVEHYQSREHIETYVTSDKRRLNLLAQGRLVNLAAGDGHGAEIMDMSFAVQLLTLRYAAENGAKLEKKVYNVPKEIDRAVAEMKLNTMGVTIDELTEKQRKYLAVLSVV